MNDATARGQRHAVEADRWSFWRDLLIGAGQAFDPLPTRRAVRLPDARTAIAQDVRILAQDLEAALKAIAGAVIADAGKRAAGTGKGSDSICRSALRRER